jgi:galactonate dehydratase
MRVTGYQTYKVQPRWLFLKIETDEGLVGWGEPVIEGRADTVRTAVDEFMNTNIIGKDPQNIEDLWQEMYRTGFYRGGPEVMSAIAGIDQALWDIKGKFYNAPVYQLLGGACRDKLKVYRWIGGDRPSDIAAAAKEAQGQGYPAIKMNGTEEMHYIDSYDKIQAVCDRVAAIQEAAPGLDIAVDFHGRVHKSMAKVLARALDEYHLMFIEEPVLSQNNEALREIARNTSTPIATGERMFSRWEFKNLLQDGYVDIIQPDLSHAGGISECKKIAAMAEAFDVAVAPHCPLGPVALAACVQLDACTPNAFIQEQSMGIHYNKGGDVLDYIQNPEIFKYKDGFITLWDAPGLGVAPNEEVLRERAAVPHNWKNPVWRNFDGTIAEW